MPALPQAQALPPPQHFEAMEIRAYWILADKTQPSGSGKWFQSIPSFHLKHVQGCMSHGNAFTKTPCPKTRMAGRTKRQDFIVLIANHQQMKDLPGMPMYEHFPWQSPKFKSGKPCQKNSTKHCKKTTDLGPRRNRRIPWACRRLSPLTWMQCLKGLKSDFQVWIFRVQKTSCLYFLTAI